MKRDFYRWWGKRVLDAVVALIGLAIVAPLLFVVSCLIKMTSRGPVFYRQERVGLDGQIFRICKFRSMRLDPNQSGPTITSAGDTRVTPLGRLLRRTKVDELPQLWNVLKGDMSLVGPRPEVPDYVRSYSLAQRRVLAVRPGITDPASIAYEREEELLGAQSDPERYYQDVVLPHKLSLSLQYVDRMSFSYDLFLMLCTARVVAAPTWFARNQ
jgi:lipopolysaccharide/colanic/teichoic acid biosynthesis glycosyltransferase